MNAYDQWIANYIAKESFIRGMCKSACEEMKKVFPNLTLVGGKVLTIAGEREHWWLLDENGQVVDPTRSQYEGEIDYIPWTPSMEIIIGKCMNCGAIIRGIVLSLDEKYWNCTDGSLNRDFCSNDCNKEFIDSLNALIY
jgi:hypothetical protein